MDDSLHIWASKNLDAYLDCKLYGWQIDSLICLNSSANKCVASLLMKVDLSKSTADGVDFLYGTKIENQWYFFRGPSIHLPREYYQKDTHTPLSFEKLHEIAMKEIFSGYLKKDKASKWEINERFFDQVVPKSNEPVASGFGECFTCKSQEEYVMYIVRKNWQYRDTTRMAKPGPYLGKD
jgi:hypothetical protein